MHIKAPNKAKIHQDLIKMVSVTLAKIYQDLIKMVSVTLEGFWMVSDRIVDFRSLVKFHRSGPGKIFSF